jgi:hypothetical protein
VATSASPDFDSSINKVEDQFKILEDQTKKDIQRLERKNEEIEIQLKNIYAQNSKEFESLKSQMGNYSRTSEVQRDFDRFEDVAGRTSEVRRDL